MNEYEFFRGFNARTEANYHKHQTERRANRNIAYRHRRAALRSMVRTVAVDAALIGCIITACVVPLACAVS